MKNLGIISIILIFLFSCRNNMQNSDEEICEQSYIFNYRFHSFESIYKKENFYKKLEIKNKDNSIFIRFNKGLMVKQYAIYCSDINTQKWYYLIFKFTKLKDNKIEIFERKEIPFNYLQIQELKNLSSYFQSNLFDPYNKSYYLDGLGGKDGGVIQLHFRKNNQNFYYTKGYTYYNEANFKCKNDKLGLLFSILNASTKSKIFFVKRHLK
jgi:hypothetical protein